MGLLDRIFKSTAEKARQPDIRFGRYSDSYKSSDNYRAWEYALQQFEQQQYLDCYKWFFHYLRDEQEDNVRFWEEGAGIRFEIFQGSKKIIGHANHKEFKAEAKVARTEQLNVGFMRRLLEKNFELLYSRFALDPDCNITIVFHTYSLDASPYKLYAALQELATNADKQDDLLVNEFGQILYSIDTSHLAELPEAEKEIKYHFLKRKIREVLEEIEKGPLDGAKYPAGIAYLLLDLVYRLDYLLKPEGYTMETLERIHRLFFSGNSRSTAQLNQQLIKEFKKLQDHPQEEFFKEMYQVTSTFGITDPVGHDQVVNFIEGELPRMDWYQANGYQKVALAIPGYIVGFCMFIYAAPKPDIELFHLYFQIMEQDYFRRLGFTLDYYDPQQNKLNKRAIKKAIEQIADRHRNNFPRFDPNTNHIDFSNTCAFTRSFLAMFRNLNLSKAA